MAVNTEMHACWICWESVTAERSSLNQSFTSASLRLREYYRRWCEKNTKVEFMKEGCEMPYSIKNQYDHGCPAAAYKGSMKGLACQLSITENGGGHRALTLPDELLVTDGLWGRRRHYIYLSTTDKPTKLQCIVLNPLSHRRPWLNSVSKQNKMTWIEKRDL